MSQTNGKRIPENASQALETIYYRIHRCFQKVFERLCYEVSQVSTESGSGHLHLPDFLTLSSTLPLLFRPKTLLCQQGFNSLPDGQQQVVTDTNLPLTIQAKSRNYASALILGTGV